MANEFKKGQYNISLPDVTKDSTLLVSSNNPSYDYSNARIVLKTVGQYDILSPNETIDLSGKTEFECQIGDMSQLSPLFSSPIYLNFISNATSSTARQDFVNLRIPNYNNIAQGNIFFNLRMFRESLKSTTWNFICYFNVAQRGSDTMSGTVTSNPSLGTGTFLYPLYFYSGSVVLLTNILGISYSTTGSISSHPVILLNYHTF